MTDTQVEKTVSKAGWKKARSHIITLPSGVQVKIELPDLPALLASGALPNSLVETAVKAAQQKLLAPTPKMMQQQHELYNFLVLHTVKEPALTEDDLDSIPAEDKELIAEIAMRNRDFDAVGHHIAGLHTNADWRKFRGFDYGDESLEGL